jgi:hypothetical protein
VGLGAQRADAHRGDDEPPHDRARRLDLVDGARGTDMPDHELVARDRAVRSRPGERAAVACERGVDAVRRPVHGRQGRDLAGDAGREQVGLTIGPEPREPGVRKTDLAAGGGLGDR